MRGQCVPAPSHPIRGRLTGGGPGGRVTLGRGATGERQAGWAKAMRAAVRLGLRVPSTGGRRGVRARRWSSGKGVGARPRCVCWVLVGRAMSCGAPRALLSQRLSMRERGRAPAHSTPAGRLQRGRGVARGPKRRGCERQNSCMCGGLCKDPTASAIKNPRGAPPLAAARPVGCVWMQWAGALLGKTGPAVTAGAARARVSHKWQEPERPAPRLAHRHHHGRHRHYRCSCGLEKESSSDGCIWTRRAGPGPGPAAPAAGPPPKPTTAAAAAARRAVPAAA